MPSCQTDYARLRRRLTELEAAIAATNARFAALVAAVQDAPTAAARARAESDLADAYQTQHNVRRRVRATCAHSCLHTGL